MKEGNGMGAPKARKPKSVTILGSTGSIGRNTVNLIEQAPDAYRIEALTAGRNVARLVEQARKLNPQIAVIGDASGYRTLKTGLAGTGVETAAGPEALVAASARPVDWVMAGIVGAAGLRPTFEAIRHAGIVAIANKECLVCAGGLMMKEAARCKTDILPADSEHNAIFQMINGEDHRRIEKITLTASGGPFRTADMEAMEKASCDAALAHPTWEMGPKISIDSATMMNKGLELIEASYLFDMPEKHIEILVHPQSIVHGLVSFTDGTVLAHLGTPDMRIPISYTLGWPDRIRTAGKRLDLGEIGQLSFEPPDPVRFPAIRLAREVMRQGGSAPAALNAANEEAVAAFMEGRIGFLDIVRIVEETVTAMNGGEAGTLDEILAVDAESRSRARHRTADFGSARA